MEMDKLMKGCKIMNYNEEMLEKEVDEWLDTINAGERYENVSLNWWYDEKAAETYGADYHFSIVVAQQTDSNGSIDVSLCEVGEDWVEVTPFNYMNNNYYLSGVGMYSYEELKSCCIEEPDEDELKNFLFEEYCTRKGIEEQYLTANEQFVLEWAAGLLDEEFLAVLNISLAPQEWDDEAVRVEFISFPVQLLYGDICYGNIVHEVGVLGETSYNCETRELGLRTEDIQGVIDAYKEYIKKV